MTDTSETPRHRSPKLNSTLEFMRLLWALDHDLQRASKRMIRTLGVTGPQRLVIRVLGVNPGMSAGQLAHALELHPSTLTGILQRLVQRQLVARSRDASDGRRVVLRLTPLGQRVDTAKAGTVEALVRRALARTPVREVEAAAGLLARLGRVLSSGLEDAEQEGAVGARPRPPPRRPKR